MNYDLWNFLMYGLTWGQSAFNRQSGGEVG